MDNPVLKRVLSVSFWSLANALALRLLNLIALYAAARLLSPGEYGSLALIQNTTQTWSIFLAGGISLTVSKYVGEFKTEQPARTASIISTLTIITALLWLLLFGASAIFSHQVSVHIFSNALQRYDLWILLAWVLLMTHQTTMQGAVTGLEKFRANALYALIGGVSALVLILLVVPNTRNWIILSLGIGTLITASGMTSLVYRTVRTWQNSTWKHFDAAHVRLLLRFGLPAFLSSVVVTQAQWYANLKVAAGSGGLSELAGLNIALQWYAVILFIPGVVSNSMLPTLSRLSSDRQQQTRFLMTAFGINVTVSAVVASVAIIFRRDILALYGEHYVAYSEIFLMLVVAATINGASSILMQQIASFGKGLLLLIINVLWMMTFIGYLQLATPEQSLGSVLVAESYVAANIVQALLALGIAMTLTKR